MSNTKLFCALDFPTTERAWDTYKKIRPHNPFFKVGLELFLAGGPDFVRQLVNDGAEVFLDLKFHDIPNTVAQAVSQAASLGVKFTNIHLSGGREMAEAVANLQLATRPALLGVTVLTSMNEAGLNEVGVTRSLPDQVLALAKLAKDCGLDGVVCSGHELPAIQKVCGKNFLTMVPGIRPADSVSQDQKRTMTPAAAAQAGAHYIVVGRPITSASDPVAALQSILRTL